MESTYWHPWDAFLWFEKSKESDTMEKSTDLPLQWHVPAESTVNHGIVCYIASRGTFQPTVLVLFDSTTYFHKIISYYSFDMIKMGVGQGRYFCIPQVHFGINQIAKIPDKIFDANPHLEDVRFWSNYIRCIPKELFTNNAKLR